MNAFSKLLLFFICALSFSLSAQQPDRKEELRSRQVQLQDEIEVANRILSEARENRQSSLIALQTLNQKINFREELIRTIDREIELIESEIEEQETAVEELEAEIDTLKTEYANMIRQAYASRSQSSRLLFVLSSDDFAQAIRRVQYLRQYSDFRLQQVAEIEARQSELEHQIAMLNRQYEEKENLRNAKAAERGSLLAERTDQQSTISELQQTEGSLREQIAQKQAEADRLENEIQRIIAAEIARERERATRRALEQRAADAGLVSGTDFNNRTTNARLEELIREAREARNAPVEETPAASESFALTPEAARLGRNFAANKGSLPWPVERGIVVSRFGRQPHPLDNTLVRNNPHIEIATQAGSEARAAFEGTVIEIIRLPGEPITLIMQHGNYFTHYGNLSEVYVKKGDQLQTRQAIGKIFTNPEENQTVVQFGLWKDGELEDPYPWLAR